MLFVQPTAERCSKKSRNDNRPANKAHHSQAEPDALRGVAPRLELACRGRTNLRGEGSDQLFDGSLIGLSLMLEGR